MNAITVDKTLSRLDVSGIAHLGGVFEGRLERTAQYAAKRIDLLASESEAVLEFDAIGCGEVRRRTALADRDGLACGARLLVHGKEHGRQASQRGGGRHAALDQEIAAGAGNHIRIREF